MRRARYCAIACALAGAASPLQASPRQVPRPLAGHPGNIFLTTEDVVVQTPVGDGATWQLVDYDERVVQAGRCEERQIALGKLPCGYYEVQRRAGDSTNRVSVGVLEILRAPTPATSPISTDAALAWLVPPEQIKEVANLATLAGMNWVRDRLNWPEMEPARGQFATSNRYDFSVNTQAGAGLRILEVTHISPGWANPTAKRFPLDLRDAFEYHRVLARRWKGQVSAFEPWNEADIDVFGGHTGSEMASLQKAAYLGLKAGNPKVIACLNVFAIHRRSTLDDFAANEAWPYFDTFNLHHYEPFAAYPRLYADFRAVSAGRPLWVTECSLPVKWTGDERSQEPSGHDLRIQSERIAITYALAMHEGAQSVFFFILPHFVEGQTQFGVLRRNLTPRPAYLALAAVGRLLADAQPLGGVKSDNEAAHGYLFRTKPAGRKAFVLVAWSERALDFSLPEPATRCFDHLGRDLGQPGRTMTLGPAPVFLVFEGRPRLPITPPPRPPARLRGKPSPIVLQALMPDQSMVLDKSAYMIQRGLRTALPLFIYNFGSKPARGRLSARCPGDWAGEVPVEVEIQPGERKKLDCYFTCPAPSEAEPVRIDLYGDFGRTGQACLSVRFVGTSLGSTVQSQTP